MLNEYYPSFKNSPLRPSSSCLFGFSRMGFWRRDEVEKKSGTKQVKEGGDRKGRRERREITDFYLKIRDFKGVSSLK